MRVKERPHVVVFVCNIFEDLFFRTILHNNFHSFLTKPSSEIRCTCADKSVLRKFPRIVRSTQMTVWQYSESVRSHGHCSGLFFYSDWKVSWYTLTSLAIHYQHYGGGRIYPNGHARGWIPSIVSSRRFPDMFEMLSEITEVFRLRISSRS